MKVSENESDKIITISPQPQVAERMQAIIDHYEKGNRRQFSIKIGARDGAVVYFLPGGMGRKGYPGYEVIAKTLAAYPEVSAEWLIRGEGKMLDRKVSVLNNAAIEKEKARIAELEKEVEDWKKRYDAEHERYDKLFNKFIG